MSFHKKQRENRFNKKLRARNDETVDEEQWRCPAFCAVCFAALFNLVAGGVLVGYCVMRWNG